jgi:acyl carrier protein
LSKKTENTEARIAELLTAYLETSGHPELAAHGPVTGATNLVSDFTLDSFRVMEFLMEVEESFDIMIDMNQLADTHTVHDLAQRVHELLED